MGAASGFGFSSVFLVLWVSLWCKMTFMHFEFGQIQVLRGQWLFCTEAEQHAAGSTQFRVCGLLRVLEFRATGPLT